MDRLELFDTHVHLDDEQFDASREQVLERAQAAGVTRMIAVGTTTASSLASVAIAEANPGVFAAVGIQPNYTHRATAADWDAIVRLARQSRVVALGETGLDRYWDYAPFAVQQDFFERHLRLSQEMSLPFIVHMRECGADILAMLVEARQRGPIAGVMHSFTGDLELMRECVDLGLYISFAGMVTYKKSDELRSVAAQVPANRILIETDAPYLSPHPKRGQRPNEPALMIHTASCLAEQRGLSVVEFARLSTSNALTLFDHAT